MPGLSPRRLSGQALRLSARAGRVPLLGATVRAANRDQLGLAALRRARLGEDVTPLSAPPAADGREGPAGRGSAP